MSSHTHAILVVGLGGLGGAAALAPTRKSFPKLRPMGAPHWASPADDVFGIAEEEQMLRAARAGQSSFRGAFEAAALGAGDVFGFRDEDATRAELAKRRRQSSLGGVTKGAL